jgi:ABC-type dipeptide/oligopeptide/nickel transport system permease subunit
MSDASAAHAISSTTERRDSVLRKMLRIPRASFGLFVLAVVLFCAVFAPFIAPFDPEEMDFERLLSAATLMHPLGTDQLGRDTLSRLIYGSQTALVVSVGSIALAVVIGVPLGLVSVYFRGWVDDILMRIMDGVIVFPSLLIAVALAATMGSSLVTVILAIGIANVPWIARIVRSQGLSIREQDFVAAAIAGGMGHTRVIAKHIFPNTLAPVIVQATLGMGYAVLVEAALGFIGVGVQPPTPTWGNMLQAAFPLLEQQPMLSIVPGIAIFLLVLAFNFVGDSLRDLLDPRLRGIFH